MNPQETIQIAIDIYKNKASDIELSIVKPTEYGRWPTDDEFAALRDKCDALKIIKAQVFVLEELLDAVSNNHNR